MTDSGDYRLPLADHPFLQFIGAFVLVAVAFLMPCALLGIYWLASQ